MKINSDKLDKSSSKKKIHIPLGSLNRIDKNQPVYYQKKKTQRTLKF